MRLWRHRDERGGWQSGWVLAFWEVLGECEGLSASSLPYLCEKYAAV